MNAFPGAELRPGADAHARLLRLLGRAAGPDARLIAERAEPWLSATFAGMRHQVAYALDAEAADRLAAVAGTDLPGHLLADLRLVGRARSGAELVVELAALTVERAEPRNGRVPGAVGRPCR